MHVGSSVALVHKEGAALEDGGRYTPNAAQLWMWDKWCRLVDIVRSLRKQRAHIVVVWMGEFIDGRHHETTQLLSQAPEIQACAALDVVMPLASLANESYVMRGTEAHSGKGAASDYSIGREIGARKDPETGMHAFYQLSLMCNDVLFDIAHHVSSGGDDARLYGNAIRRETANMRFENPRVNVVLRGHVHRYSDTGDAFGDNLWGAVIPAWQLKTAFTHRVTRRRLYDVGTTLITCEQGFFQRQRIAWQLPQPPTILAGLNHKQLVKRYRFTKVKKGNLKSLRAQNFKENTATRAGKPNLRLKS